MNSEYFSTGTLKKRGNVATVLDGYFLSAENERELENGKRTRVKQVCLEGRGAD